MESGVTVYLSSTYEDLKDHRRAAFEALRKAGYQVKAMEDYVATDRRPVDKCLADVARANIYVGIFAFRYGYVPPPEHNNPNGLSITELEYRHAESLNKTCLCFVVKNSASWQRTFDDAVTGDNERGEKISRLRKELLTEKTASSFSTPHELASLVQAAITQHLKDNPPQVAEADTMPAIGWDIEALKSPYPGLMHFTRKYAPVFFGREVEVSEVLDRLCAPEGRFVIISGDSGTGKSSMVDAGVLPRLETGLPGDRSARSVRMVPSQGNHPFDALMRALHPYAQEAGFDAYQLGKELYDQPEDLPARIETILAKGLDCDVLVVFLDQMEELFATGATDHDAQAVEHFLAALYRATQEAALWVITTIRSDLLHHCYHHTDMLRVLNGPGHYALGRVEPHMMYDMIVKPTYSAGLRISETLVRRLTHEAGPEPGNLPLLAFVLQRLFDERQGNELSEEVYDGFGGRELGGLKGALADYAASSGKGLVKALGPDALERLPMLFDALLVINVEGLPTRRRTRLSALSEELRPTIEHLLHARLLTTEGEGEQSTVSVAHEKLFEAWPALAHWIAENEDDLRTLSMGQIDAQEWHKHDYDIAYLWHPDRLERLQVIIERVASDRTSALLRDFAWPQDRLIERLSTAPPSHEERLTTGRYLAQFGDPRPGVGVREDGLPDIAWVEIPGGEVRLEGIDKPFPVEAFETARYPISHVQFQAFIEAEDGYRNTKWWQGIEQSDAPETPRWSQANGPRETVSWYEAVALCLWLSAKLGYAVRLPSEFEWQQAATGGDPKREYPWGKWEEGRSNSSETGLNRTTAVGFYPHGTWAGGPLDMAGNVWEWCLNKYDDPEALGIDRSDDSRALRGGSWNSDRNYCCAASRSDPRPGFRSVDVGFRVVRPRSVEH